MDDFIRLQNDQKYLEIMGKQKVTFYNDIEATPDGLRFKNPKLA